MHKIAYVTPEQAARFEEWAKKWIDIGLSTEPADFEKATNAALEAYELCGLKKPIIILHVSSPYAATIGGTIACGALQEVLGNPPQGQIWDKARSKINNEFGAKVNHKIMLHVESHAQYYVHSKVLEKVWVQGLSHHYRYQIRNQIEGQIRGFVSDQMGDQIESQINSTLYSKIYDKIQYQVGKKIGEQIDSQARKQIGTEISDEVWNQVGEHIREQIRGQISEKIENKAFSITNNDRGGALGAYWCAYVSFFRDVMGWQDPVLENFKIDEEITKSCGWVWWHENVLAISDRPQEIHKDDQNRLHNEVGPSIAYRDGWSLYHWHGVAVPKEWIENKESLSAKTALSEPNLERRRAACEIVGWTKILKELNGKTIDTDEDPQIGELIEVKLPDNGPQRFLRVLCATQREFAIPVPLDMRTALQASAWTYGIDDFTNYKPEVRT